MNTPGRQTSISSFFNKTPKAKTGALTPNAKTGGNTPNAKTGGAGDTQKNEKSFVALKFTPGSLVFAKLAGYPWWPSLVCNHPTEGKHHRKNEIHVQFFDETVTRAWIGESMIKSLDDKVPAPVPKDVHWEKGVKDAEKVKGMSNEERIETLLVEMLPSDDEDGWGNEDVSPGSKENKPTKPKNNEKTGETPPTKRRRIIMMDSDEDDSGDDKDFKPSKKDMESEEEDSAASEGVSEEEPDSDYSENESPVKGGSKRKRPSKTSQATKKTKYEPKPLSTPIGKFASSLAKPSTPFGNSSLLSKPSTPLNKTPLPAVCDSTKKKLAMFGSSTAEGDDEGRVYSYSKFSFLKPENIKDADGNKMDHPDYNPRTLYVPPSHIKDQTPGQRQWWALKAHNFDVVLFFKMGKFYELYHMDAEIGVNELNLLMMKGDVAHAGFPEIAYGRYAATLLEKGYKVARIEQTETPAMMEERCERTGKKTKFDKVVAREICQVSTKGTRVNNYLDQDNFEGEPSYLLALVEKVWQGKHMFGVAFVDTTIGVFHMGQFEDDRNLSRLRTLTAHFPPVEILTERGQLSQDVQTFLSCGLASVRKEGLRSGTEFWESGKTLQVLAEGDYFKAEDGKFSWPGVIAKFQDNSDSLGLTAGEGGELAVRSLGAVTWYLKNNLLDTELLSMAKFEEFCPVDHQPVQANQPQNKGPSGKYMVLDGVAIRNLELVINNSTGGSEATLLARLDHCNTAMGKRALRHWLVSPLLQRQAIIARQNAVQDLIDFTPLKEVRNILKKLPDLERLLSKINSSGNVIKSRNHPDSRAIMYEGEKYSKRKIMDLLSCLDGFKLCSGLLQLFSGHEMKSKMLRNIVTEVRDGCDGGEFPKLQNLLEYFNNAFDHQSARKEGKIIPSKGVDTDLDEANQEIRGIEEEMKVYLSEQKKHFGNQVKYWGTGKNRFQLEVPEELSRKAGSKYELASGTKKLKRYVTSETKEFLARMVSAEDAKDKALQDITRKMFAQFSSHADTWRQAIGCLSLLDSLSSLAIYSGGLTESCMPQILEGGEQPVIEIEEGRHPCLDMGGDAYIPNDTKVGGDQSLIILTGPNMGGKSTLMRQTGLLVVLAQLGCRVPAAGMRLNPVDRVFTRLGASDNIVGGESTFFVELQETGSILQHSSPHSLVLVDELGRGTATYDGTAIAGAVVTWLAKVGCRTLFSTHYHSLATEARPGVVSAHMGCMVENDGTDDISQETITFLYKLVDGPCPKSHGFNAAKLAGLPDDIIRNAFTKAREFEMAEKRRIMFQQYCSSESKVESAQIRELVEKIKSL